MIYLTVLQQFCRGVSQKTVQNSELPDSSKTVKTVKTVSFQILPKQ